MSEQKELFAALAKAQAAYKPVNKSGINTYFNNSKYPTLTDFIEASFEALSSNGLSISQWFETKDDGKTWLKTTLAHSSGETKESSFVLLIGKQDMQGFGSAGTYGRRYAYAAAAGLAPEDDDGNASTEKDKKPPRAPEKPKDQPRNDSPVSMADVALIYEKAQLSRGWNKADLDTMLINHYKVESPLKLKKHEFDKIMTYLDQRPKA